VKPLESILPFFYHITCIILIKYLVDIFLSGSSVDALKKARHTVKATKRAPVPALAVHFRGKYASETRRMRLCEVKKYFFFKF
jgi:hypothetical protein